MKKVNDGKSSREKKPRASKKLLEIPAPPLGGKRVQVCIRLKRDQRRALQKAALDRDMSVQDLILDALKAFGIDLGSGGDLPNVAALPSKPGSIDHDFDGAQILAVMQEVTKIVAAAARLKA